MLIIHHELPVWRLNVSHLVDAIIKIRHSQQQAYKACCEHCQMKKTVSGQFVLLFENNNRDRLEESVKSNVALLERRLRPFIDGDEIFNLDREEVQCVDRAGDFYDLHIPFTFSS